MKYHFIAIGGSVMHQLALSLQKKGYQITGSDDEIFEPALSNLKNAGILPPEKGWFQEKINKDLDGIILGMHAKADNPELIIAKKMGIPIYSFPEYIFKAAENKLRIAIAGSHGKTSTTSMIVHILQKNKKTFDFLVGAKLEGLDNAVQIAEAPIFICEADEYPASSLQPIPKFLFYKPQIAVITGIAWDHINVFPSFEIYVEQFEKFILSLPKEALLIYNQLDEELVRLIKKIDRKDIEYTPYGIPTYTIKNEKTYVTIDNQTVALEVFGDHNLQNLLAAYKVCLRLGINTHECLSAIQDFKGANKRLELIASTPTMQVYRDFAHAPSKLKATIKALRKQFPTKKLIAIFELYTYSSLNEDFLKQYHQSLVEADAALIFFSAHSLVLKGLPMMDKHKVLERFGGKNLTVVTDKNELLLWLEKMDLKHSVVAFMSSGNFDNMAILDWANEYSVQ